LNKAQAGRPRSGLAGEGAPSQYSFGFFKKPLLTQRPWIRAFAGQLAGLERSCPRCHGRSPRKKKTNLNIANFL